MKTISIEVPDNAEEVHEAVTGNSFKDYIQTQTNRWVDASEKTLLTKEAELSKEEMLTSAISRHVVEKEERLLAEAESSQSN